MKNPKPLTNSEGEVRELTEEDFQRGMNFSELPKNLQIKGTYILFRRSHF
jgi:hypothetical protein